MPKITFVQATGERMHVDVSAGLTLMEGAIWNDVDGIDAECGGSCACATCHVYIGEEWAGNVTPATSDERDLLSEVTASDSRSRLSCQIKVNEALEGMEVHLPANQ